MVEGGVGGWGELSALTRCCVPPPSFFLKVRRSQKGRLNSGCSMVCGGLW